MAIYKYAALEGGGAKGFIYLGVAQALAKLGLLDDLEAISGASVGAMGALLLSTGWPVEKMQTLFNELKFSELASGGLWEKFTSPYTYLKWFGLHRADRFHELFKKIVKEVTGNENTTFAQWHQFKLEHPELKLKDISVEACNLNTKLNETFSHLTQHKDVPIADAVRASMGFPVYFTPWKIKGCLYGDGGEQNNCPSNVFEEKEGEFNPQVLTVRLDSMDEIRYFKYGVPPKPVEIKTAVDCTFAHFEAALNSQNRLFHQSPYKDTTVYCDTLDVPTLKFDLSDEEKTALSASGEYAVVRYFHKHHPEIVENKYDKEMLKELKAAEHPICFTEFLHKQGAHLAKPDLSSSSSDIEIGALTGKKPPAAPILNRWCDLSHMKKKCASYKHVDYKALAHRQQSSKQKPRRVSAGKG